MSRKKELQSENYLERIPVRAEHLPWKKDAKGLIILEVENKGFFNRLAQKLFDKPKITQIHLDEMGSFLWPLLDGDKDIISLGELVREAFGEAAEPLYERLAKYFQILDSYHFITWK